MAAPLEHPGPPQRDAIQALLDPRRLPRRNHDAPRPGQISLAEVQAAIQKATPVREVTR